MDINDVKSEVSRAARSQGDFDANKVQGWVDGADDEILSTLVSLYLKWENRFRAGAREIAEEAIIPFAIRAAAGGSSELSRYEGLEIVSCLFKRIWKREHGQGPSLKRLKSDLSKLITKSSERDADRVITAVLEHIFVDLEIRHFFSDWERHRSLQPAFTEAVRLADGWIELDRSNKRRR